jgi:hypothetical protein
MKSNLMVLSLVGILSATAAQSWAQSRFVGDGIAASPRVRQMLNERPARIAASTAAPTVSAPTGSYTAATRNEIAASPKVLQRLSERPVAAHAPTTDPVIAGYTPTGDDGIAASPKVRQMLNERTPAVQIAPLK